MPYSQSILQSGHSEQKTVLVTGGTAGIGKQITLDLAVRGCFVYFTGRDATRGAEMDAELRLVGGQGRFVPGDLSSQSGVMRLASQIAQLTNSLDVLVNNVGGVFERRVVTPEGLEATLALNHVHPTLLAAALLPLLEKRGGRVISLSTGYLHLVRLTKDDLDGKRWDCGMNVYGRSKLISVRAGEVLGQIWASRGLEGRGVGWHFADPGMAETPLTKSMKSRCFPWYGRFLVPAIRFVQRHASLAFSSTSSVFLATQPVLPKSSGVYVVPGPRILPKFLVGYRTLSGQELLDKTVEWIKPDYRDVLLKSLSK